jgi:hypothetical protein
MAVIVVDILFFRSLFKILILKDRFDTVYYCSRSKYISLAIKFASWLRHIQFKDFAEFSSSRPYTDKRSRYEEIETRLSDFCDIYLNNLADDISIREYCRTNQLDLRLTKEYLRHNAYWLLYRPVEIMVKCESLQLSGRLCFILRKSPVIQILAPLFKRSNIKIILYQYWGFSSFLTEQEELIFDLYIKETYFNNPLLQALKTLRDVLLFVANSFCSRMRGNIAARNCRSKKNRASIGIDKYLNSAEEDCFWVRPSQIDPGEMYYFEERTPPVKNVEYLTQSKINRVHIVNNPLEWLKSDSDPTRGTRQMLAADWGDIKKSVGSYLSQWFKSFSLYDSEYRWKLLMLLQLRISYDLWKSVFQQLGIKMLISFSEIDPLKTAKTMAASYSDGVVISGHLSNNQLYYVPMEWFCDVALIWGQHFHSHIFQRYPLRAVVITGYYFDFIFKEYYVQAKKLRMNHPGMYIITFMDNVFSQDIAYSSETIKQVYSMFFDIIDSHPNVLLFIKPKREKYFHKTRKVIPIIDKYISRQKILLFIDDKPAYIALASDLVIGLGISSAATESQFARVPSFHFDLSCTENNQFAKNGLGKIVFQSVKEMREAIEKQINSETAATYEEIDYYYRDLDPFRDGRAAERIGAYFKRLLHGYQAGLSREAALDDAAAFYCNQWGDDKVISLPYQN